jgi:uncharacterized repeat protein (TIGR02543 family)
MCLTDGTPAPVERARFFKAPQWSRRHLTTPCMPNGTPLPTSDIMIRMAQVWTGSTPNSTHQYGVTSPLTTNGFTRPGYIFNGWSTSSTGGVQYTDGDQVSALTTVNGATMTLYAVWTGNTYFVAYNGNGSNRWYHGEHDLYLWRLGSAQDQCVYTPRVHFCGLGNFDRRSGCVCRRQSVLNLATRGQ